MIKITKQPEPDILAQKRTTWTNELLEIVVLKQNAKTEAEKKSVKNKEKAARAKYRDEQILAALRKETKGKCAYCECETGVGDRRLVEHVVPWALFPILAYEWSNLILSCWECNNAKGVKYDENDPNIDPSMDEPEQHITFAGPFIAPKSPQGVRAVTDQKLDRPELFESRRKHLRRLLISAELLSEHVLLNSAPGTPLHKAFLAEDNKYSKCANEYVKLVTDLVKEGLDTAYAQHLVDESHAI